MSDIFAESGVLVSIIIPVYNNDQYLHECINSVLAQYYSNLEIILVDDGSTDLSGRICDQFADLDQRIKVFHTDNEGLGYARNYGIRQCHGVYIMFVDADDYIAHEMVEDMLRACLENHAELCVVGYYRTSAEGSIVSCVNYGNDFFVGNRIKNELLPRMISSLPNQSDGLCPTAWGKLYLTSSIKDNHVLFHSERELQSEDIAFQLEYLPNIHRAVLMEGCYYYYRRNPLSLTMQYKKNHFEESVHFYYYVVNYVEILKLPCETSARVDWMLLSMVLSSLKHELPAYSHKSFAQSYQRMKEIINNRTLQEVSGRLSKTALKIKPKVYCDLLIHKRILLLMLALEIIILSEFRDESKKDVSAKIPFDTTPRNK